MNPISHNTSATTVPSHAMPALRPAAAADPRLQQALELREAFTSFFGETFFSQMIQAMRTSTGKAAYFDGGRAEEVFRGQLDQTLAQEMTAASADRLARPMFEHQFPDVARLLSAVEPSSAPSLVDLSG